MRQPVTLTLLGLLMALGSSSQLHAQGVQPISYEDLVSRIEAVETSQYQNVSQASAGCKSDRRCYVNPPPKTRGGVFFMYEAVWVTPFFSNNTAYEVFDSIPTIGEDAQSVEFDSNFEYSSRIEFGYIIPGSGLGWRARYWNFDTNSSMQAADPFPADGRIEVGLHDDPDIEVSTGNNEFVRATHALNLDVVDLEVMVRRGLSNGQRTISGGLRYLRMDQGYRADFIDNDTGIIDDIVTSTHTFEGVGPTVALGGVRRLGLPAWSLFGIVRSSLVFGNSSLQQARIDPQTPAATVRDFVSDSKDLDLLFIGELQLGVQYERPLSNGMLLFGRLGMEAQYWPSGGSGASQNGEDSDGHGNDPRDADMGFLGVSASVGTNW